MIKTHPRPFRFGAMVHQDYEELALLLPELEDHLNEHIDLTECVEKIYFVPVILPEANENHEEASWYDEEEQKIFLRVRIDPDDLDSGDPESFLRQISTVFLTELGKLEVLPEDLMEELEEVLFPKEEN